MKGAYPVIIDKETFVVDIPDFNIKTEGTDIENCIEMAREAIGLSGISLEDIGKAIPKPSYELPPTGKNTIGTFGDVDFDYYRQNLRTKKRHGVMINKVEYKTVQKK